jgi:hypothetical protein
MLLSEHAEDHIRIMPKWVDRHCQVVTVTHCRMKEITAGRTTVSSPEHACFAARMLLPEHTEDHCRITAKQVDRTTPGAAATHGWSTKITADAPREHCQKFVRGIVHDFRQHPETVTPCAMQKHGGSTGPHLN